MKRTEDKKVQRDNTRVETPKTISYNPKRVQGMKSGSRRTKAAKLDDAKRYHPKLAVTAHLDYANRKI